MTWQINQMFEEVAFLLWYGRLPKKEELDDLKQQIAQYCSHS